MLKKLVKFLSIFPSLCVSIYLSITFCFVDLNKNSSSHSWDLFCYSGRAFHHSHGFLYSFLALIYLPFSIILFPHLLPTRFPLYFFPSSHSLLLLVFIDLPATRLPPSNFTLNFVICLFPATLLEGLYKGERVYSVTPEALSSIVPPSTPFYRLPVFSPRL